MLSNPNAVMMAGDANPALEVYTDSGNEDTGYDNPNEGSSSGNKGPGSSGGGCDSGLSISGMLIALIFILRRKD